MVPTMPLAAAPNHDNFQNFQALFAQTAFDSNSGDVTAVYQTLTADPANQETVATLLARAAQNRNKFARRQEGYFSFFLYRANDQLMVLHS